MTITVTRCAELAGVTAQAIRWHIKRGNLKAERFNADIHDWVVEESDFDAWMQARGGKGQKRGRKRKEDVA